MTSDAKQEESGISSTSFTSKPLVLLGEGGATKAGWHHCESYLRCPKEFQFSKIRGIGTPQAETPEAFAVGGLFHAGRAYWFSRRFASTPDVWPAVREVVRAETTKWNLPITVNAEQRALDLLLAYMNHYAVREHADPIAAEYLLGPSELVRGEPTSERTARLDDVSRYPEAGGALCIGESKTTSESLKGCVDQYTLHGQPLVQAALWKLAPQGEAMHGPIAGVMLDVVKKPYGNKRPEFRREFVPITDYTMQWYVQALADYLKRAALVTWNTKEVRNVQSCTRLISGRRVDCHYKPLCMHGRSSASQYVLADGTPLTAWKPEEGKETPPWL